MGLEKKSICTAFIIFKYTWRAKAPVKSSTVAAFASKMSLKKTSTRKKSVTWQDVSEQSSKSAAVEATSLSSQIGNVKQRNHNTPIIQFQLHNIPFHFLGIVYYFLYVDYEKLVKYETINSVLYKALPLTYLGQIVWLSLLHVTPPVNEKKKHISAQKSKRIEFNPTVCIE